MSFCLRWSKDTYWQRRWHQPIEHHRWCLSVGLRWSKDTYWQWRWHQPIERDHWLEKVLLDPIFMILKCDFFTHFGSCFLKLHDVSTSHLEALVTWCFLPREMLRKSAPSMNREQGYQLPLIYHQLLLPEQYLDTYWQRWWRQPRERHHWCLSVGLRWSKDTYWQRRWRQPRERHHWCLSVWDEVRILTDSGGDISQ